VIGAGIISFDRPQYLAHLLASLEAQRDAPPIEYHLFQDGAINCYSGRTVGDEEGIQEAIELFLDARLESGKVTHVRADNVGIGINQFEAYELMVERYRRIVMLEDDVVLSPYWARLLPVLFEGLEAHPDVFGFSTSFRRHCAREHIEANLGRVAAGTPHWWMIAFTPGRWLRIRPHYLRYYELIEDCDYNAIPHGRIVELFRSVGYGHQASSQDGGKDMAVELAGMHRVRLTVNRGISIGREGVHFNPRVFEALGFEDQSPYVFESDATRNRFTWTEDRGGGAA